MTGKMPPNFSWVVDGLLAALAYPRLQSHYVYMKENGISQLVSLTERPPQPNHDEGIYLFNISTHTETLKVHNVHHCSYKKKDIY